MDVIRYPVWAHDEHRAWMLDDLRFLQIAEQKYIDDNRLNDLKVIDIDRNFYRAENVKIIGKAGILGWRPGYSGTYFDVSFELVREGCFSLLDVKNYIIEFVSTRPSIYSSSESFDDFKERLLLAKDMNGLIASLK